MPVGHPVRLRHPARRRPLPRGQRGGRWCSRAPGLRARPPRRHPRALRGLGGRAAGPGPGARSCVAGAGAHRRGHRHRGAGRPPPARCRRGAARRLAPPQLGQQRPHAPEPAGRHQEPPGRHQRHAAVHRRVPHPLVLRIASLDQFDGTQWRLSASTDELADGSLEVDRRIFLSDAAPVTSSSSPSSSSRPSWLPAAYQPVSFTSLDGSVVRYDIETSTLISDEDTQRGHLLRGHLDPPRPHARGAARRPSQVVPRSLRSSLDLPDGFSPTAERIAQEATAGAATHYDKALALQDYFRESGGFTYSTDVTLGQGTDAIDEFLQRRRSATASSSPGPFAAMARSLGIPARVAVGYTLGRARPQRPEPLPGPRPQRPRLARGVPRRSTAGCRSSRRPGGGTPTPPATPVCPAPRSTTPPPRPRPPPRPPSRAPRPPRPSAPADETAGAALDRLERPGRARSARRSPGCSCCWPPPCSTCSPFPARWPCAADAAAPRAAGSPGAEVGVAWIEVTEGLAAVGVRARPDETHTELAARASEAVPPGRSSRWPAWRRRPTPRPTAPRRPRPTAHDRTAGRQPRSREAVDTSLGRGRSDPTAPRPPTALGGRARRHRTG